MFLRQKLGNSNEYRPFILKYVASIFRYPWNYPLLKKLRIQHYYFYFCYFHGCCFLIYSHKISCRYWLDTKIMQNLLLQCAQLNPMFFQEVVILTNSKQSCLILDVIFPYLKELIEICRKGQNSGVVEYWRPYNICCHRLQI